MLIFIDKEKWITVFRLEQSETGATRVRLGTVSKSKMQVSDELRAALGPGEIEEVEGAIDLYQKADSAEKSMLVFKFPQIIREVTDYIIASDTPEFNRRVLTACLMDGVRQIRKYGRGND